MIKTKYIFLWVLVLGFSSIGFTQTSDSALYRTNNVKSVETWVRMVGFEKSNDTCLSSVKDVNKKGQPTYIKMDYHCQGWDIVNEIKYEYNDKGHLTRILTEQNEQIISNLNMTTDEFGRTIREENTFFEPSATVIVQNKYFGPVDKPDSMFTVEINNGDTLYLRTDYTYVDGRLKKSQTMNTVENKAVNMVSNRYDEKGRMVRSEFIYFLGYDSDNITRFEYNDKDQIVKTKDELNNLAAEFYYDETGLPVKAFYYNKFGALERETWFRYKYFDE